MTQPTYSLAHGEKTMVEWDDPIPPDIDSGNPNRFVGRLRTCSYCGSMHPSDVAAAIQAGARGEWADWKYGWPHKAYFDGVPNPHVGLLESRSGASERRGPGWFQTKDGIWREPGTPAPAFVTWKFYTVHLIDATPEEKDIIESMLGIHFEFSPDGKIKWEALR